MVLQKHSKVSFMIVYVASSLLLKAFGSRTMSVGANFVRYSIEEGFFEYLYKRS
jgi:hypothetical protein